MKPNKNCATNYIHSGQRWWKTSETTAALSTPIFETSTFIQKSPETMQKIMKRGGETYFKGEDYIYSRGGNPTQRALEIALTEIEGGDGAVAFSSGMAAITATALALLKAGDQVICLDTVFGDTHFLFSDFMEKFKVETSFVDASKFEEIEKNLKPNTKMIFVETPANPNLKLVDLKRLGSLGKRKKILTVVDNTFASPFLQNPLKLGCDLVIHSLTKYISGHSDAVGGIVIGGRQAMSQLRLTIFATGAVLDPFAAFLILRGLKTLPLRMEKHCTNAMAVAKFLENHPKVVKIFYPGLSSHAQHKLAKKQMKAFGGILAFELKGGMKAGKKLMKKVKLCKLAVSLGAVETLIEHPASMTHAIMSKKAREESGISDGLVRLSVGLERAEDIIADLRQALHQT